ncbi:YceI family protein [Acetobacter orientalis]|uniref:YceI family protein n=1 Tax=Acetobacter orientalis TaxID=146474 RepID=UPI00264E8804|nr:YceI family protein [Acetobacter sp.]
MFKAAFTATLATLSITAAVCTAAHATPFKDAQSGTYALEPTHTQVVFSLLHFGFTPYYGLFSEASGTLKLDTAHPATSSLNVTIPVSSVQTTSSKLTDELKGADWFDAAHYPTATFVSSKVEPDGKGGATITGSFTLHGITKPLTLHAQYVGSGTNPMDKAYTVGFKATGTLKRSDYDVKKYVPLVGDDVTLTLSGAFEKQP